MRSCTELSIAGALLQNALARHTSRTTSARRLPACITPMLRPGSQDGLWLGTNDMNESTRSTSERETTAATTALTSGRLARGVLSRSPCLPRRIPLKGQVDRGKGQLASVKSAEVRFPHSRPEEEDAAQDCAPLSIAPHRCNLHAHD
eukprot:4116135-Alexandrium_andersonii.AAC.1